jgi:hypothetical protein
LTRLATLLGAASLLVAGAAAVSVVAIAGLMPADTETPDAVASIIGPTSNRDGKTDKLPVVAAALTRADPEPAVASLGEPLRQAFAPETPSDLSITNPAFAAPVALPPAPKPKAEAKADPKPPKPPVQKTYTLLSDAQIAAIRGRLNLSPSQEYYWPSVEGALRNVARKIHATRQANPNASGAPPIDPDSEEVQQLKSAAMPLLFRLREDQKQEVRSLARIIGLHAVAAQI